MTDSARQQIVTALKTLLQKIEINNGYGTDAGFNVFEWRIQPLEIQDLPAIVLKDTIDKYGGDSSIGYVWHELNIEIEAYADETATPLEMRKMLADIETCIGTDKTLNGLVCAIEIESAEMQCSHDETQISKGVVSINIGYQLELFNPN